MLYPKRLVILSAVVVLLEGCGDKETVTVETPAKAASQMEEAFASAGAEVKQGAETAAAALKSKDYEHAYVALQTVQYRQDLTYEQTMAARNSMFSLQKQLAEASLRGDTNAQRVIQLIRQTQPR